MSVQTPFVSSNHFYSFLCAFLIGVIAFAQYTNTFEHEYVLDDVVVISMNDNVKKGLSGIPNILKNYDPASLQVQNNYGYRPVTLISFAIDMSLFGQNPRYGHISNVLYFSLLCIIIFFTLRLIFPYHSHWLPFLVTLLFAVHPIHTEVVANIKSRDEILSLLFCLLALQSAFRYVNKQSKIYYFLFCCCFLLAIFSKEQALLFVFIIPVSLVMISNISLQKFKIIIITLASLFTIRWFIGLQNNVPLFLSLFVITFGNLLFYYFYTAKIQSFSNLKQSITAGLNVLKQPINKLENKFLLLPSLFIGVFLLGLLAVFFEILWFIILISAILLIFFNSQKSENKSLLLVLSSILFSAYGINSHSSLFLLLSYLLLIWLFVFHKKQFKSNTSFVISFLFISTSILSSIKLPFSILTLGFLPLFVFSFRQTKTMIVGLISLMTLLFFFIFANLTYISIDFVIVILLFSSFSLLLFLTHKKSQSNYIFATLGFILLIGHFSVLSNTAVSFSDSFVAKYQAKNTDTDSKPLSSLEKDIEYGFFIESPDLNNSFLWTHKKSISTATSFYVLGRYLKNFFIPHPLVYFYGYNQIPLTNFANWKTLLSILIHILLIISIFYYLHRHPTIAFAAIFYLISISLYSQLIFYVPDTMADRYFFTSSLALSLLIVLSLAKILKINFEHKKGHFWASNNKLYIGIFMLFFALIIPSYAYATYKRNKAWKNNITLFEHDLKYMENCARAHYYYANELLQTYHILEDKNRIATAEKIAYHFGRSIEISDKSFASYLNLAHFYLGHRMFEQTYQTIQLFNERYSDTFHAYNLLGNLYFQQENFYKAIEALEKAYEKAPKNNENYFPLAWSYYNNGDYEKAVQILEKGIALGHDYEEHYLTLSDIHFDYGEYKKAQKILEVFIKKYPNTIASYEKLIYQLTDRNEQEAVRYYQRILQQNMKK